MRKGVLGKILDCRRTEIGGRSYGWGICKEFIVLSREGVTGDKLQHKDNYTARLPIDFCTLSNEYVTDTVLGN
jgi:hypothetical protein